MRTIERLRSELKTFFVVVCRIITHRYHKYSLNTFADGPIYFIQRDIQLNPIPLAKLKNKAGVSVCVCNTVYAKVKLIYSSICTTHTQRISYELETQK